MKAPLLRPQQKLRLHNKGSYSWVNNHQDAVYKLYVSFSFHHTSTIIIINTHQYSRHLHRDLVLLSVTSESLSSSYSYPNNIDDLMTTAMYHLTFFSFCMQ